MSARLVTHLAISLGCSLTIRSLPMCSVIGALVQQERTVPIHRARVRPKGIASHSSDVLSLRALSLHAPHVGQSTRDEYLRSSSDRGFPQDAACSLSPNKHPDTPLTVHGHALPTDSASAPSCQPPARRPPIVRIAAGYRKHPRVQSESCTHIARWARCGAVR